ncbi:short-chain dehydrogenase/reductase [Rhodocollybia butyracea]|uniref:Short-chain dehydrogenase/reductase n=1 Tax=Rhodocollybia butyracea TaxID=206335 RepID=A0A9P5PCY8_9AGAR|nr:short-chain dehydrogenase/reductase [Rhodocollybia butyracea]
MTPTYHNDTYPAISPTKSSLNQSGKTILITGRRSGIGFEIARSFANASASRIIIVGRRNSVLKESVAKLRDEFKTAEFITRQGDIGSAESITSLWEFLHAQSIFVHVLQVVLNAAYGTDTVSIDWTKIAQSANTNLVGNFHMSSRFIGQTLRPSGQQLNLINISTGAIHAHPVPDAVYATTKAAFTSLVGRIADERPAEDVQIISFHPGSARVFDKSLFKWDAFTLPANFSVWAASPEASWLHGRFVWGGYLKVGVKGLGQVDPASFLNN